MPYDFNTGGSATVTATELVASIYDQVDNEFYDVKYPEILWNTMLPAASYKTDVNPGAQNHIYRTRDIKGMGQFIQGSTNNIPRVGQVVGQVTVPILDAAVGAEVTDAEARRYSYGFQTALSQELGGVMRKAADYHLERTFFFGEPAVNFLPFLDYPDITKIPISPWTGTDPRPWVKSINDAIAARWTASKTVFLTDTVQLPPAKYALLTEAFVVGDGTAQAGVAVSALEYLIKNNIYTAMTGKPLTVKPLRYLEGAGVAGVDRGILMETKPENFVLPFPLAYQLAQPVPIPLGVTMFAIYIFGSFNIRQPLAMAYVDGM